VGVGNGDSDGLLGSSGGGGDVEVEVVFYVEAIVGADVEIRDESVSNA